MNLLEVLARLTAIRRMEPRLTQPGKEMLNTAIEDLSKIIGVTKQT